MLYFGFRSEIAARQGISADNVTSKLHEMMRHWVTERALRRYTSAAHHVSKFQICGGKADTDFSEKGKWEEGATVASLGLVSPGLATDGVTPIFSLVIATIKWWMTFFSCRLVTTPQLPSYDIVLSVVFFVNPATILFHSGVTPPVWCHFVRSVPSLSDAIEEQMTKKTQTLQISRKKSRSEDKQDKRSFQCQHRLNWKQSLDRSR